MFSNIIQSISAKITLWRTFGTPQTCGGRLTGDSTGAVVGKVVGKLLGDATGAVVGEVVGKLLGDSTGAMVGEVVGRLLGGSTTYCKEKITVEEATFSPPINTVALTSVGVLLITSS